MKREISGISLDGRGSAPNAIELPTEENQALEDALKVLRTDVAAWPPFNCSITQQPSISAPA